jgi:hypothetical protein
VPAATPVHPVLAQRRDPFALLFFSVSIHHEGLSAMLELKVTLDFDCCLCASPVSVTVKCSGKGLQGGGDRAIASVKVPCPDCGGVNLLSFQPIGLVHSVAPCKSPRLAFEPSLN